MTSTATTIPTASQIDLEKLIERIFAFRQITRLDQRLLMSVLLAKDTIAPHDNYQINRVFEAVQSGAVQVVE